MSNPQTSWTHNGVLIEFTQQALFKVRIAGNSSFLGSLAAARKYIDKATPFKPFEALRLHYNGHVSKCVVIGVDLKSRHVYGETMYILEGGGRTREVYPLSARVALERFALRRERERKAQEAREARLDKALAKIPKIGQPKK